MRAPNPDDKCIGYRLNILGVRVWSDRCQLVAKDADGSWIPLGPSRPLPVYVPADPARIAPDDTLVLTAYQYDMERPGSDLRAVLARTKDFETALAESAPPAEPDDRPA